MTNFYKVELKRLNVDMQLNTDAIGVDSDGFDQVLLATGINAGKRPADTFDAGSMLIAGEKPADHAVTVFGDTEVAMFTALWLAKQGLSVTLSSPADQVGVDTNDMQSDRLLQLLPCNLKPLAAHCPASRLIYPKQMQVQVTNIAMPMHIGGTIK